MASMMTRTNRDQPVPFACCGQGIDPDSVTSFGESTSSSGTLRFGRGYELLPFYLKSERI